MSTNGWEENTDFLLIVIALAYLIWRSVIDFSTKCATICGLRIGHKPASHA